MEKITLSPEARDRIIENVTDELSSDGGYVPVRVSKTRSKAWRKYITVAACCILVVAGAMAAARSDVFLNLFGGGSSDSGGDAGYSNELSIEGDGAATDSKSAASDEGSYMTSQKAEEAPEEMVTASAAEYGLSGEEELSEKLGFSMNCTGIQELSEKEGLTDVSYNILGGSIGEIVFSDGEHSNYFRKAVGTEDISGDYDVYDIEAEFDGEDRSGTLKGDAGSYKLAVWTTADGFTYAAYLDEGLTDEEWFRVIDGLTGTGEKGE